MGPPNRLGAWRWYRRTVYQDGHPAKPGGYPIEQEVKMDSQLQPMWESLVEVDNLDGPPSTFPALSRSPATQPAPEEKEGLSLADVDKLCAEFGFHYDDDQGETLEILQDMISASLARWGPPSAAAPEPGESLATPPAPEPGEVGEGPSVEQIEEAAKLIYASMRFAATDSHGACDWVDRGNSLMQDEARRTARAALARWCRPATTPAPEPPSPSGYAYRYRSPFGGTDIRFNGGQEVNGGRPIEAVPYWFAPPSAPATSPDPTPKEAARPTYLDAIRLAQGCHDYSGGHSGTEGEAWHGAIDTVVAVLKRAAVEPWDSQLKAVYGVGVEAGAGDVAVPEPVPVAELDDQRREAVHQAVAEALGSGAYDCLRVWEAWGVGTMGPDDFVPVAEDSDRVAEIADAAIEAIRAIPAPAPDVVPGEVKELVAALRADAECVTAGKPDLMQLTDKQLTRIAEILKAFILGGWIVPTVEQVTPSAPEKGEGPTLLPAPHVGEAEEVDPDHANRLGTIIPSDILQLADQLDRDGLRLIEVGYANESLPTRDTGLRVVRASYILQQQEAELAALRAVPVPVAWCRSDDFANSMNRGGSFSGWKDPGAGANKCDMQLYAIPLPAPEPVAECPNCGYEGEMVPAPHAGDVGA
jgi:hypothetical protein